MFSVCFPIFQCETPNIVYKNSKSRQQRQLFSKTHRSTPIKTQNAARSYFQGKYIEHYVKLEPCKTEFRRKGEELNISAFHFLPQKLLDKNKAIPFLRHLAVWGANKVVGEIRLPKTPTGLDFLHC